MTEEKIKLEDIYDNIYDYENRWYLIEAFAKTIGLSNLDEIILKFVVMGNISDNPDFFDVLKKIKLPTRKVKYNKDKLERWAGLIRNEMEALDKYGVLKMDTLTLLKESQNGRYVTVATMNINVLIYKSIYKILTDSPEYLLQVIYGVYDSLGMIVKFLDMEKFEE